MQKPLAYANDLADHDVIEDDGELVFGPHPAKLSAFSTGHGRQQQQQLGSSSSFKEHQDSSILGSAPLVAKLAQSLSVPTQPVLAPRYYTVPDGHVYAGGNPIISIAPTSRPSSAAASGPARQPCTSSETSPASAAEPASATCKSAHRGTAAVGGGAAAPAAAAAAAARRDGGTELQIDIQSSGRDRDSGNNSARPKSGLLRRLSSLTSGTLRPVSRPPSAKHEGAAEAAATPAGASGAAGGPDGQPRRVSLEPYVPTRSAAIPCVDVAGERRQMPRKLSLLDAPPAALTAQAGGTAQAPKDAVGGAGQQLQIQATAEPACLGPRPASGASAAPASTARISTSAAPRERPSTPLRRLSRLLSGSLIAPASAAAVAAATTAAVLDQRDQDGAGASKSGSVSSTGVGLRDLFSRPSSARRKSDAGSGGGRSSQSQVPMEAWKDQQRHGPEGSDDGPDDDCVKEFGAGAVIVRQSSGVFRRAANAFASALAR